ncbi:hypothetical protein ILUMI_04470, partial [Ignelater luminosus]
MVNHDNESSSSLNADLADINTVNVESVSSQLDAAVFAILRDEGVLPLLQIAV